MIRVEPRVNRAIEDYLVGVRQTDTASKRVSRHNRLIMTQRTKWLTVNERAPFTEP